ncbi:MAG: transcriptional repressor [Pseudomonadota bacterium]
MTEANARQCLEAARLRPTAARIGVLQTLRSAAPEVLCTEALFRLMLQRGVRASAGTAYRAVRKLLAHGVLEREWDDQRRAVYRIAAPGSDALLRLVCRDSGQSIALDDADLYARLRAAAQREGLWLSGQGITIYIDGIGASSSAGERPSPRHD